MKTINEQIAERMGWEVIDHPDDSAPYIHDKQGDLYINFNEIAKDTLLGSWFAKLIQAQLVKEGWMIEIYHGMGTYGPDANCVFECLAWKEPAKEEAEKLKYVLGNFQEIRRSWADTEPAAIVSLACKIWGIK